MIRQVQSAVARSTRRQAKLGFTLVELMVATTIFTLAALGATAGIIQATKLTAKGRYRDRALTVLQTLTDQFQNAKYKKADERTTKPLFTPTTAPTGTGLAWNYRNGNYLYVDDGGTGPTGWTEVVISDGDKSGDYALGTDDGLKIYLARPGIFDLSGAPIATITREVTYIDPTTGATDAGISQPRLGWLLKATFTLTYRYGRVANGGSFQDEEHRFTAVVLRHTNITDK